MSLKKAVAISKARTEKEVYMRLPPKLEISDRVKTDDKMIPDGIVYHIVNSTIRKIKREAKLTILLKVERDEMRTCKKQTRDEAE